MYKLYGIPNCDTVKKSMTWLKKHNIGVAFHDYKKEGITASKLKDWVKQVGIDSFLNKKSSTWRGLDADAQATAGTEKGAIKLMTENTSMIKRPLIEKDGKVILIGFDENAYMKQFSQEKYG